MNAMDVDIEHKARAGAWFEALRDRICAAFERLEDAQTTGPFADLPPARFTQKETERAGGDGSDAGGGVMSVMRDGRVFEKVGVNVSTVHGLLGPQARRSLTARKAIPDLEDDPRFWASGISVVAHMRSPLTPAVHMNTRLFWTPGAWWFGGGADLNPMIEDPADTASFHAALKAACDRHDPNHYPRFKAWADEYFYLPHRDEHRGVGGIFFDYLEDDLERRFGFTRAVGDAFLDIYPQLVLRHMDRPWSAGERAYQLERRGRYVEFNLLYDRGTQFGLKTGGNPEAILMSLPPVATWP
jgi:coproporphyrinogen III oxidase